MDTSLGLEISDFVIKSKKKEYYYCIDLISMKYEKKIEDEKIDFSIIFKNDENLKIENFSNLQNFNWLKKELLFKKTENKFLEKPFIFDLEIKNKKNLKNDQNLKNENLGNFEKYSLFFEKDENLDGIPQWLNFKENIKILISYRKFQNKYDFENYLKSKKIDYSQILQKVEKGKIYEQNIFFDKCKYFIKLNFLKISDFEKKINTLKLKSPFLEIDLNPLNEKNKNNFSSKRKIFPNLSNSLKNGICQNSIFLEEEINFEFSLPIDLRILPTLTIKLLEKEIEKKKKNFSKISKKVKNLGESKIEIFDFYLKQQILLFRKIYHLEKILKENSKIQYRDIILPILKTKLTKIEETLIFTKNLKTNFSKTQNSVQDENLSQKINLDRKKKNYFHFIKKKILAKLDKDENVKLNYDIKNVLKENSKKNIKKYENSNFLEDEIIFDSSKFKIKPEKKENSDFFEKKKIKNFKRISFFDEKSAHYRFIIKTNLEDSFYLDLNDFWNDLEIFQKTKNLNFEKKIEKKFKIDSEKNILNREKMKTNLISDSYLKNIINSEKSIISISQNFQKKKNFKIQKNSFGKIWTNLEMFDKDDLLFYTNLENLGLDPENLGFQKKREKSKKSFEKLKLRIYITNVIFEKDYDPKNLFVKIFLEEIEISEISLFEKKNKKENGYFFLEINEMVEKLYNLGFSKNLKIIFCEKNENFKEIKEIAETYINLDQRYYNKNWLNLIHKPIETRILKSKDSDIYIGKLNLWLEIINKKNEKNFPKIKISRFSPIPEKFQIRVVFWNLENLENILDQKKNSADIQEICVEGQLGLFPYKIKNDIFPKIQFSETYYIPKKIKKIDMNYRMIWNFDLNCYKKNLDSLLYLKIKNKTTNEVFLRKIDFTEILEKSIKNKKKITMEKKIDNKIIQNIKYEAFKKNDKFLDEEKNSIKLKLKIEIFDEMSILKFPANIARNEPNEFPFLKTPKFLKFEDFERIGDFRRMVFWAFLCFVMGFLGVLFGTFVFSTKVNI